MSDSSDKKPKTLPEEVLATIPSSAEQDELKEKAQPKKENKINSTSSSSTVGYFLTNFVLPSTDTSKLYVERLYASNAVLGSYGGNDSNLAFVGYGLLFISEVLKYSATAADTASNASSGLLPWLNTPVGQVLLQRFAGKATAVAGPARSLSNLISDIRIFNRLWGLVPLSVWAVETWAQPPQDPVLRGIAYTQVAANLAYQPLENIAYLAMHNIIPASVVSERAQTLLWIYSCYLWALHVVLDLGRLYRESQLQKTGELPKNDFSWYQYLAINLSYLPLTVHWSLEKGCLNDVTVGALGTTAALASIYPKWKNVFK